MNSFGSQTPPGFTGFNSYAAGAKRYGAGRSMPNIGPTSGQLGYAQRDNQAKARKNAILKRLKGTQQNSPIKVMLSSL